MPYRRAVHTVVETPTYLSDAKNAGLNESDRARVVALVARSPTSGDMIEGSGGARKLRVARKGQGKSGGFRVLFAYLGDNIPVYLLAVFAKNERANLSRSDLNELATALRALKLTARRRRL
jgi:hypothetical protein